MKIELPCFRQEQDYSCLPACIRIVLRHYGSDFSESAVCSACNTTDLGTDQNDAARGIAVLGFKASKLENATLEDIIRFVRQNKPVIVVVSVKHLPYAGGRGMHAVVVSGFETDRVSFIDPGRGEEITVQVDTFLIAWQGCGRLGLLIEPS